MVINTGAARPLLTLYVMTWNQLKHEQKLFINLKRYCENIANDNRQKCIDNLQIDLLDLLPAKWSALDLEARLKLRQQLFNTVNKAEAIRRERWRVSHPDFKAPETTIELIYKTVGTAE